MEKNTNNSSADNSCSYNDDDDSGNDTINDHISDNQNQNQNQDHISSNQIIAIISLILFLMTFLIGGIIAIIALYLRLDKIRAFIVKHTLLTACFISRIKIRIEGNPPTNGPILLISNHSSYLDIFVLGAISPVSFTPKKEIESWPFVGSLCKSCDCIFIERSRSKISQAKEMIAQKLNQGKIMCVFAEGTTNNGLEIKPFKTGLFSLAEDNIPVQTVTISYTKINKQKVVSSKQADYVAWYDTMAFIPHLKRLLGLKEIEAKVTFHEIVKIDDFNSRKDLALYCENKIKQTHEQNLIGF